MEKKRIAFTLIELLVVIAIIGILSGLIVVTMNGVTQKANIAKAQVFSNSLRNALMMNLVSDWNFDGSGILDGNPASSAYLLDTWGQKNGSVTSAPPAVLSGTNCVSGSCLSFSGSQYVSIPYDSIFNFGTAMTAMVWIKGEAQTAKGIIGQWETVATTSSWVAYVYNNKLLFAVTDNGTRAANHYKDFYTNTSITDNNWHLVGFTWNAGVVSLYIDGQSVAYTSTGTLTTNSIYNSSLNLTVGSLLSSGLPSNYFTGKMDEVRLYNKDVPISQVKEQYYTGLNDLLFKELITKKEYVLRIVGVASE